MTLADAEQYAASLGIRLNASDRDGIAKAQAAERKRRTTLNTHIELHGLARVAEWINQSFPRLLEALIGSGDMLLALTRTLIIAFGVPTVLGLLMVVEQQRIVHGLLFFETDPAMAAFAAFALVILNLVFEIQIHHVEHQAGFRTSRPAQFSLRLWAGNAAYTLGIGTRWEARPASPARRYKQLLRLVTFSILALTLLGSMRTVITTTEGVWYDALITIVTESNLTVLMTWVVGLLFALAAVLSAQGLSSYVALRTAEVIEKMTQRQVQLHNGDDVALDAVGAQYVLAKIAAAQPRNDNKAARETDSTPLPFSANGASGS
jgi:hypothetical protein